MIPHKNLFTGALGKLQNIGGSRMYTTPHTASVPTEYSINVSFNVQGDLVGHSLDGRLWLYRRSRRLGVIALTWNTVKGELEYTAGQNISNNDDIILACGLDWILTNNNIFMVADEEPYIRITRLFDANIPATFLYSILRSGGIEASGIDPFTGEAWGKREDNGNSEGTGYFSKTTHLLYPAGTHSFEQCYSLLPAVGDWQIFENFLVRRPDAEDIASYHYMQAVRPLIPLEFNNGAPVYGTGYNYNHRGIQLAHRNGEIYGKGFHNIGRVSILPAVFGEDGSAQEYYLYIHTDFTLYPYADFFYCNISTSAVNADDEQITHSFAVSSVTRSWLEANSICEALGGHLATSTNAEKNAFLSSLIGSNTVWLGSSDQNTEGTWAWITGEAWSYTNWNNGEPNNSGDEDYLVMQASGKWNDEGSAATHYYICEWDYELDERDFLGCLWQNIAIAPVGSEALYGFVSEQSNALNGAFCFRSVDGRILVPDTGEILTLSEHNGRIFFDALSHKGLSLDDDGGQLLLAETISDIQNIECKTFPQWIAPASKIDTVTGEYVVASTDNIAFCTSLVTGFNRQSLSPNTIPLSARAFQNANEDYYRLAVSEGVNDNNRKVFGVNQILSQHVTPKVIQWQDVYKEPVHITFVNTVSVPQSLYSCTSLEYDQHSGFDEDNCVTAGGIGISELLMFVQQLSFNVALIRETVSIEENEVDYITYVDTSHSVTDSSIDHQTSLLYEVFPSNDPYPELTEVRGYIILSVSATIGFLNPVDGSIHYVSLSKDFAHSMSKVYNGSAYLTAISRAEVPYGIGYVNNTIGFYGYIYDRGKGYLYDARWSRWGNPAPMVFFPCDNMPDFISNVIPSDGSIIHPSILIPEQNGILGWNDKNNPCYNNPCYIAFQEYSSGVKFLQQSSIHTNQSFVDYPLAGSVTCPNYSTKFIDSSGIAKSKQNFHLVVTSNRAAKRHGVSIFHSELYPEILDFSTELERSKLS